MMTVATCVISFMILQFYICHDIIDSIRLNKAEDGVGKEGGHGERKGEGVLSCSSK